MFATFVSYERSGSLFSTFDVFINLGEYKKAIEQLEAFSPQGDATEPEKWLAEIGLSGASFDRILLEKF